MEGNRKHPLDVREVPDDEDAVDALVDAASFDSFPASDPPPFWAGTGAETYPRALQGAKNLERHAQTEPSASRPDGDDHHDHPPAA